MNSAPEQKRRKREETEEKEEKHENEETAEKKRKRKKKKKNNKEQKTLDNPDFACELEKTKGKTPKSFFYITKGVIPERR